METTSSITAAAYMPVVTKLINSLLDIFLQVRSFHRPLLSISRLLHEIHSLNFQLRWWSLWKQERNWQLDELLWRLEGRKDRAASAAVREAADNGISKKGRYTLKSTLNEFPNVLRIRLGKGPPADVPPIFLDVKEDARPARTTQRQHPQPKREFLGHVTGKLMKYDFLNTSTEADYVEAPLIVPKSSPANFRLTMYVRPINSATKSMPWPILNIESELGDLRAPPILRRYWLCVRVLVVSTSRTFSTLPHVHGNETTKACVMPTRTLQVSRIALLIYKVAWNRVYPHVTH